MKLKMCIYFYNDIICELSIDDWMVKVLDCGWTSEGLNLKPFNILWPWLHDLKQSLWCGKYY